MKKFTMSMIGTMCLFMMGCRGALVEVPPAHKGKIFTSAGFQQGIKSPSSFRLPYEFATSPKLVIAEASDQSKEEKMEVVMPEDNLILRFDVRGTYSIVDTEDALNNIFDRLPAQDATNNSNVFKIDFDQVYNTYATAIIRTRSREVMSRYRIDFVMKNIDTVSTELQNAIINDFKGTPIKVLMLGLANVKPPDVIIKAQEAAAERTIAIEQAEADKLVSLKKAEAALEVAKKQQQVELIEAETQVLVDKKLAEGVSEAWLRQRGLSVLEKLSQGDNKIIFLPMEALSNPGIMLGIGQMKDKK